MKKIAKTGLGTASLLSIFVCVQSCNKSHEDPLRDARRQVLVLSPTQRFLADHLQLLELLARDIQKAYALLRDSGFYPRGTQADPSAFQNKPSDSLAKIVLGPLVKRIFGLLGAPHLTRTEPDSLVFVYDGTIKHITDKPSPSDKDSSTGTANVYIRFKKDGDGHFRYTLPYDAGQLILKNTKGLTVRPLDRFPPITLYINDTTQENKIGRVTDLTSFVLVLSQAFHRLKDIADQNHKKKWLNRAGSMLSSHTHHRHTR